MLRMMSTLKARWLLNFIRRRFVSTKKGRIVRKSFNLQYKSLLLCSETQWLRQHDKLRVAWKLSIKCFRSSLRLIELSIKLIGSLMSSVCSPMCFYDKKGKPMYKLAYVCSKLLKGKFKKIPTLKWNLKVEPLTCVWYKA